jgi:GC-rich sequence DNA-binding factor
MDVDTSGLPISTLDEDPTGTSVWTVSWESTLTATPAETAIPALSSIAAAREKRTRLRAAPGAGDDYISLSLVQASDAPPSGPHPDSRLVREEDELGEGDDGRSPRWWHERVLTSSRVR